MAKADKIADDITQAQRVISYRRTRKQWPTLRWAIRSAIHPTIREITEQYGDFLSIKEVAQKFSEEIRFVKKRRRRIRTYQAAIRFDYLNHPYLPL